MESANFTQHPLFGREYKAQDISVVAARLMIKPKIDPQNHQIRDDSVSRASRQFSTDPRISTMLLHAKENLPEEEMLVEGNLLVEITFTKMLESLQGVPLDEDWKRNFKNSVVPFYKNNQNKASFLYYCKIIIETVCLFCHNEQGELLDENSRRISLNNFCKSFNFNCPDGQIGDVEKFYQRLRFPNSCWPAYNMYKLSQEVKPYVKAGNEAHLPALFDYIAFNDAGGDKLFYLPLLDMALPHINRVLQKTVFEMADGVVHNYSGHDLVQHLYEIMADSYNSAREESGAEEPSDDHFSDVIREKFSVNIFNKLGEDNEASSFLRDLGIDYVGLEEEIMPLDRQQALQKITQILRQKLSIANHANRANHSAGVKFSEEEQDFSEEEQDFSEEERDFSEEKQDFLFQAISALNAIKTFSIVQVALPLERKEPTPIWLQERLLEFVKEAIEKGFLPQEIFSARVLQESRDDLTGLVDKLSQHVARLCDIKIHVPGLLAGNILENEGDIIEKGGVIEVNKICFHPHQKIIMGSISRQSLPKVKNIYLAALQACDMKFLLGESEDEAVRKSSILLKYLNLIFNRIDVGNKSFFIGVHDMISKSRFAEQFSLVLEWMEMYVANIIYDKLITEADVATEGEAARFEAAARPWLKAAAGRGNPDAQMLLGYCFGVFRGGEPAKKYYRDFSLNPRNYQKLNLSFRFVSRFDGIFHERNREFSHEWFTEISAANIGENLAEDVCAWFCHQSYFGLFAYNRESFIDRDKLLWRIHPVLRVNEKYWLPVFITALARHALAGNHHDIAIAWFLASLKDSYPELSREVISDVLENYLGNRAEINFPQNINLFSNAQKQTFFACVISYFFPFSPNVNYSDQDLTLNFIAGATRCFAAIKGSQQLLQEIDAVCVSLIQQDHTCSESGKFIIVNYLYERDKYDSYMLSVCRELIKATREWHLISQQWEELNPEAAAQSESTPFLIPITIDENSYAKIAAAVKMAKLLADPKDYFAMPQQYRNQGFIKEVLKVCQNFACHPNPQLSNRTKELQKQAGLISAKLLFFCEHLNLEEERRAILGSEASVANITRELFEDKNHEALNRLANMYYYGQGGAVQNYEQAFHLYKMAAIKGNAEAKYNLGYCYLNKIGTPQVLSDAHLQELGKLWLGKAIAGNAPSSTKARALLATMNPVTSFVVSAVTTAAESLRDKVRGGGASGDRIH